MTGAPLPRLGPYRYSAWKWDDYLRDIQSTIVVGARSNAHAQQALLTSQREAITNQTAATVVAMSRVSDMTSALGNRVSELRDDLNLGFSLLAYRLEAQESQLNAVLQRLASIEHAVNNPMLTRAREQFRLGRQCLRRGLRAQALAKYGAAETLYDVDFVVQLEIGKLYLYGYDEDDIRTDLHLAERHLLLARKYALAAQVDLRGIPAMAGEALLHLSQVSYVRASEAALAGQPEREREFLEGALVRLESAAETPLSAALQMFACRLCARLQQFARGSRYLI